MKRLLCLLLLICSPAWAQIDAPKESDPYKLIVARLTTPIPDGAYLADGGWEIVGASATVTADVRVYGPEIVWTGTPGVYSVVFDGVLLKDITFKDGDGNTITIKSYLGRIKARAACKILGSTPGPNPPVPPCGAQQIVFWITEQQLDNLPQGQRDILNSYVFREWLVSQKHVFLEVLDPANFGTVVPAKWVPWVESISGDPLPRVSMCPVAGGPIVDFPLPADIPAMKALLGATARKAVAR